MKVGFVGIGNMGGPLARRLVGKVDLAVHDRSQKRMAAFAAEGADATASAAALARGR